MQLPINVLFVCKRSGGLQFFIIVMFVILEPGIVDQLVIS